MTDEWLEPCPVCEGEDPDCVWCEDSPVPGFVPHDCPGQVEAWVEAWGQRT